MNATWETRLTLGGLITCLPLCLMGCPDTDAAVFVELSIQNPTLEVETSVLATAVSGSFDLRLHLGPRATDAAEVTLGSLSVTNHDQTITLIAPLAAVPNPAEPWIVNVDSDVDVSFTIDGLDNEVEVEAVDALCDPGGIIISGAFDDSLEDALKPVTSRVFHATGCP